MKKTKNQIKLTKKEQKAKNKINRWFDKIAAKLDALPEAERRKLQIQEGDVNLICGLYHVKSTKKENGFVEMQFSNAPMGSIPPSLRKMSKAPA